MFTFADAIALQITEATIDPLTTLGLTPDRVTFSDNELFVNVESLRFSPSTFVRINLDGTLTPTPNPDITPATVPEPGTLAFLGGAALLGLLIKRQDQIQAS
ncbi:MAG: PEP-CTERM sorting domain-containing protein [Cyanobacteria bacterium P01_H01_bin.58]